MTNSKCLKLKHNFLRTLYLGGESKVLQSAFYLYVTSNTNMSKDLSTQFLFAGTHDEDL